LPVSCTNSKYRKRYKYVVTNIARNNIIFPLTFPCLILRKKFRGITFFASFETPISVIKISVLIYCILKLTFSVKIWTCYTYILLQLASFFDKMLSLEQRIYLIQYWTGFRHIITKLNEKFPNTYVSHHAWVFRSLNFDVGLNYVEKTAES
jgi:hypothetical protein